MVRRRNGAKLSRRACNIFLGIAAKGHGELICSVIGGAAGGMRAAICSAMAGRFWVGRSWKLMVI